MISTRDLGLLPDVQRLRLVFQSMALLDAIIEPEWLYRYYSFESKVPPDGSIAIGSMRNRTGDELQAVFGEAGCLIRGFATDCPMAPQNRNPPTVWPGVLDEVPSEFAECMASLGFDRWRDDTLCLWRGHSDDGWRHGNIAFPEGPDPDGSAALLTPYDGRPETYHLWAEQYYQPRQFDIEAIRFVYESRPLTEKVVRALNPERVPVDLIEELRYIGYVGGHAFYD
jgi:hypothetical protein